MLRRPVQSVDVCVGSVLVEPHARTGDVIKTVLMLSTHNVVIVVVVVVVFAVVAILWG